MKQSGEDLAAEKAAEKSDSFFTLERVALIVSIAVGISTLLLTWVLARRVPVT